MSVYRLSADQRSHLPRGPEAVSQFERKSANQLTASGSQKLEDGDHMEQKSYVLSLFQFSSHNMAVQLGECHRWQFHAILQPEQPTFPSGFGAKKDRGMMGSGTFCFGHLKNGRSAIFCGGERGREGLTLIPCSLL